MYMCLYVCGVPHAHGTGDTGRCESPNLGSETDLELGSSAGGRVSHLSTLSSQEFLKMYQ